ncbi:hypothetical protein DPM19_30295 [Actinomadura craniellae]|uniref:Peptidase S8/S53 domain-containing protein n=1 Tax=Actinomadura craniellae TaxID=2231787 RepID=A0A365GX29_9ACTN|nr:S8 family serine peptidase [Actinomadura craniellae]RAY11318.1 hypothetical protein DPM19_30295 [Actinomadura craniellae]
MRRLFRWASATLAGAALLATTGTPALALPSPREEQWWFGAWQIHTKVWKISQGQGVTVALIDTGIQARVPDLRGVVLKGIHFGPQGGDGRTDGDPDGDGHGTGMAALIAAQGRGTGMLGVAPKVRLLPVGATGTDLERSLKYAADHGADVINISAGWDGIECPEETQQMVAYAIRRGAVIVASASNKSDWGESTIYPASCAGVLAVGALRHDLQIWELSTPGWYVSAAAPGMGVASIGLAGTFGGKGNGTSQAAALTSGAAALVRARYPELSNRQVVQRLLYTTRDVGPKGWDKYTGYGAIIPYRALTEKVPANAPNPTFARLDQWEAKQKRQTGSSSPKAASGGKNPAGNAKGSSNSVLKLASLVAGISIIIVFFGLLRRRFNIYIRYENRGRG